MKKKTQQQKRKHGGKESGGQAWQMPYPPFSTLLLLCSPFPFQIQDGGGGSSRGRHLHESATWDDHLIAGLMGRLASHSSNIHWLKFRSSTQSVLIWKVFTRLLWRDYMWSVDIPLIHELVFSKGQAADSKPCPPRVTFIMQWEILTTGLHAPWAYQILGCWMWLKPPFLENEN